MPDVSRRATYSPAVGLVYIFNIIIGNGVLTMPKAFSEAGWLVSAISIILLAFFSYITMTFVIEAMASANAIQRWRKIKEAKQRLILPLVDQPLITDAVTDEPLNRHVNQGHVVDSDETTSLLPPVQCRRGEASGDDEHTSLFDISETFEMGQMAEMFFNRVGLNVFYLCIIIYLYGDLAIYGAAVPKTLRDIACTFFPFDGNGTNSTAACNVTLTEQDQCWPTSNLSRGNVYRIFVTAFMLLLGPFVYFSLQKTTLMQIFTTLLRWIAMLMMISLACMRLSRGEGQGHPPAARLSGVPGLFGVCVYAFMCHHSLPQITTPIRDKSRIYRLLAADLILILIFSSVLSFTGIFAFANLQDLYTLNFQPLRGCSIVNGVNSVQPITDIVFLRYFISLFPVFTISASFPIIAITLRNNLKVLFRGFHCCGSNNGDGNVPYPWVVDKLVFPTVTLAIPMIIVLATNNISVLVGVTGSYAGAGIQYVIPACFVLLARRCVEKEGILASRTSEHTGRGLAREDTNWVGNEHQSVSLVGERTESEGVCNEYQSPFGHTAWIVIVFTWAIVCVALVTVDHIIRRR